MNDKVSVITASYNASRFIEATIESILGQTYKNIELIIIDDCSSDNTISIVNQYICKDSRIKLIQLSENSGAAVARNKGIEAATGRFIAFLDSDDLWDNNKIEKQIEFMLENGLGFTFTSYRIIEESGIDTGKVVHVPKTLNYSQLLKNTIIGCLTVVIDKDIIGEFSMPLVRAGQDTATWLSILRKGHIAYGLDETLASYRTVRGSISSNRIKSLKRTWFTYRKIERLNIFKCVYYYTCYIFNAIKKRL